MLLKSLGTIFLLGGNLKNIHAEEIELEKKIYFAEF
jgi:hypothetical protein